MCAIRKCGNPVCTIQLQACQMIQGLCPKCYQEKQKSNTTSNVPNTPKTGQ